MKSAAIEFDGNSLTIRNVNYYAQDYYSDLTFDVEVKSEGFSGIAPLGAAEKRE